MPNTRRRRFSVQNEIRVQVASKLQNATQVSQQDSKEDIKSQNLILTKATKSKNKIFVSSSKRFSPPLPIVAERESSSSIAVYKKLRTLDKDITVSSSNIDFYNILANDDNAFKLFNDDIEMEENNESESNKKQETGQFHTGRVLRHDKHPHRIKVRSPKRKISSTDRISKRSVAVSAINFDQEVQVENDIDRVLSIPLHSIEDVEVVAGIEREIPLCPSVDDMCRICHGGESLSSEFGQMISACSCRGTVGRVHVKCLERWLTESGKSQCELCGTRYATRRVHKYGVLKAFMMWVLSQNAKQLMVDSLGIMLMSPLAVLAAWLSGRTLAGLMTYEAHVTPWPLASTFVLACMTLVCYYCWIVSAATRHALAWWIWYRSQYEVRLLLQD